MTEYSTAGLKNQLGDNNVGAITEEDVRSIVDYARVHAISIGVSRGDVSTVDSVGDGEDEPFSYPLVSLSSGGDGFENTYGGGHLSVGGQGITYTDGDDYPNRLFRISWSAETLSPDAISAGIAFYVLTNEDVWGTTMDDAWRAQISYLLDPQPVTIDESELIAQTSTGSLLVELAPGDVIVPTYESYEETAEEPVISFIVDMNSVGVVNEVDDSPNYNSFARRTQDLHQQTLTSAVQYNLTDDAIPRPTRIPGKGD